MSGEAERVWYCETCDNYVDPWFVTFDGCHEVCGMPCHRGVHPAPSPSTDSAKVPPGVKYTLKMNLDVSAETETTEIPHSYYKCQLDAQTLVERTYRKMLVHRLVRVLSRTAEKKKQQDEDWIFRPRYGNGQS